MPSLKPLRRVARSFVSEVREMRDDDQDVGTGTGTGTGAPSPESNEVREKTCQGSAKRAFLRNLVITSKAKLGGRQDGAGTSTRSSSRSGHDAERTTGSTPNRLHPYLRHPRHRFHPGRPSVPIGISRCRLRHLRAPLTRRMAGHGTPFSN
ncbi:hypothetical protein GGR51DRAFT_450626 [Nemania sp. FL0031]|nr:hypothetical protein GGR51DRAFT_450626 [Nemania sp. FL0031]